MLACIPRVGVAQIAADRPGFSATATTVDAGHVLVQSGYTLTPSDGVSQHSIGELDIKIGIINHFEIIAGFNSIRIEKRDDQVESSWDGPTLGLRWRMVERNPGSTVPTTAVLVRANFPVNGTDKKWIPEARLVFNWSFAADFGMNLVVRDVSSSAGRFTQWGASAALGSQLVGRLRWYGELFILTPQSIEGRDSGTAGGGLLFLATEALQFDARVEVGLYGGAPDVAFGFGAAVLF